MTATVGVLPNGLNITNTDDFPWYGLIITIDDKYSTRYHFGDPGRNYLREDSILESGETESMPIEDNFITKDGKNWHAIPYQITVKKITLEAKSQINGPYDLKATFFTDIDEEASPTRIPTTPPLSGKEFIDMTTEEYEAWLHKAGRSDEQIALAMQNFEEDKASTLRWQEQFKVHWPNVEAYFASMETIGVDRIIDETEWNHICWSQDQWRTQLTDAMDYVRAYRDDEPDTYTKNAVMLDHLENEAKRGLTLVDKANCEFFVQTRR